ncbi:hypothetical protein [Micromonospora sp. LH3U1]|uniref:hypothetical protein n=1 Tax=Micromonospora sp. LH3U1 TaxID=3018339 RepID=UPI00234BB9DE|nr:hypothetical protein [Micromonospora sp. LH3U1]WCN83307.1 hypothetical protein PCA76_09740 [Micromonospora sp. LH3U1]
MFPSKTIGLADHPLTGEHGRTYLRANRFVESIRLMVGPHPARDGQPAHPHLTID